MIFRYTDIYVRLRNYGGRVYIKDIFGPYFVKKWQQRK